VLQIHHMRERKEKKSERENFSSRESQSFCGSSKEKREIRMDEMRQARLCVCISILNSMMVMVVVFFFTCSVGN